MDSPWAYSNGDWIRASELRIAIDDLGFLLGATVTERLRTFRGAVFRLEEHLERLRGSLRIVGLDAQDIVERVACAVPELLRRNEQYIEIDDDWSIVAFATPGVSGSGRPTVCVHGCPLPFHAWANQFEAGVPVIVSDVRQVPPSCWPADLKCRSRMNYYLADRLASERQPGSRAILLDEDGCVAEASTANVLVYRDREGIVSPPRDRILSGISLGVVQELTQQLGLPFVMRPLTVSELRSADEAMLTSTSVCLLPIVQCDGRPLGSGTPGLIYQRILAAWGDRVGVDIVAQAKRFATRRA